jgi:hypothetical protein
MDLTAGLPRFPRAGAYFQAVVKTAFDSSQAANLD